MGKVYCLLNRSMDNLFFKTV